MKRGKDGENKVAEPMFPRLSVNDAEKGGPRAPPRNKMALYEQLCTPVQRFNSGRFSSGHGMKPSHSMPPASAKQVSGYGKSLFTPLHVPPSIPTTQSERPENRYSRGMNLNSFPQVELEQRQNVEDDDDYMVPIYLRSDTYVHAPNRGKSGAAKSGTDPTFSGHTSKKMSLAKANSEQNSFPMPNRDDRGNRVQVHLQEKLSSRSDSHKYDMTMRSREMIDRHTKPASGALPRGFCDLLSKGSDMQRVSDGSMHQKFGITLLEEGAHIGGNNEEFSRDMSPEPEDVSRQRNIRNGGISHTNSRQPVMFNDYQGDQRVDLTSAGNTENCDNTSETSMVDSMSGLNMTPDDVVGIIGYKHFLKARKAIANQQRVFSVQVFELHRLIQVQKLIAESPELMIDDNVYVGKALKEPPATKVPQLDYAIKPAVDIAKLQSESGKSNREAECTAENAEKTDGRNGTQMPNYGPFSGNVPPTPSSSDPRNAPWCFPQPSGHQWLVPVMSPSEGLIYKPYPGPGFMSPASGGFGPMGGVPDPAASFGNGGFMNPPPYGGFPPPYFPPYAPHPQGSGVPPGQNYFPPFSMPSANHGLSSSAVEQMHQFTGTGVHRQPLHSTNGISNSNQQPNQSSCNLQKQSSEAVSGSKPQKVRQLKGSGLQGSTASSPLHRPQPRRGVTVEEGTPMETRNPLSLFPTNPTTTDGAASSPPQRTASDLPKVIKVVPHNARSASESAARIFQSIQREREHQDTT